MRPQRDHARAVLDLRMLVSAPDWIKKVSFRGLTAGIPCATIDADVEERTCEPSWAWRDPGLFCYQDKKVDIGA